MGSDGPRFPWSTDARFVGPVIQTLTALALVWGSVRVFALGSAPLGSFLLALAAITVTLAARQLVNRVRSPDSGVEASGELAKDEFDYLVWVSIGAPVVLIVGLLVFVLVTGSR